MLGALLVELPEQSVAADLMVWLLHHAVKAGHEFWSIQRGTADVKSQYGVSPRCDFKAIKFKYRDCCFHSTCDSSCHQRDPLRGVFLLFLEIMNVNPSRLVYLLRKR